jgi:hypothetical protein
MQTIDYSMMRMYACALEDINAAQQMVEMATDAVQDGEPLSDESRALIDIAVRAVEPIAGDVAPTMVGDDAVALEGLGDWLKSAAKRLGNGFKDFFTTVRNRFGTLGGNLESIKKRVAAAQARLEEMDDFKGGEKVKLSDYKWRGGVKSGKLSGSPADDIDDNWDLLLKYDKEVVKPVYSMLGDLLDNFRKNIKDMDVMDRNASSIVKKYGDHVGKLSKVVGGKKITQVLDDAHIKFEEARVNKANKELGVLADIENTGSVMDTYVSKTPGSMATSYSKSDCQKYLDEVLRCAERNMTFWSKVYEGPFAIIDDAWRNLERFSKIKWSDDEREGDGYSMVTTMFRILLTPRGLLSTSDTLIVGCIKANEHMLAVVEQSIIAHK